MKKILDFLFGLFFIESVSLPDDRALLEQALPMLENYASGRGKESYYDEWALIRTIRERLSH